MCSAEPAERADVVVVGARIAGAAIAIHLARQGLAVTLVDRADFPSDTLSTHLIQVSGVACLQRLGVLDDLAGSGAPYLVGMSVCYDGINLDATVHPAPGWPPGGISVSRNLLDMYLIDVAAREGVRVLLRTSLVGLDTDRAGRVCGVRLRGPAGPRRLAAPLVIGADGRNSRVGDLVGARRYNVTENQRFVYWADFAGAEEQGPPAVHHYRSGAELTIGFFSDGDRFTIMVAPDLAHFTEFKKRLPDSFDQAVRACEPLRPVLRRATRCARPIGTAYMPGYFRQSAGPGWALLGDSGHFKDPTLGQGIADALRQAEQMAQRIAGAGVRDTARLDAALRRWWRWRDRDATPMYWLAWDFAKAGVLPALEREILRDIAANPRVRQQFIDEVLSHRLSPYRVLTPPRILRATRRLYRDGPYSAPEAVRLMLDRLATEGQRLLKRWRPRYAPLPPPPGGRTGQAMATEVWAGDTDGHGAVRAVLAEEEP